MNARRAAVFYIVSVSCSFIAGSYATQAFEMLFGENVERVNAIAMDISAKPVATKQSLQDCPLPPLSSLASRQKRSIVTGRTQLVSSDEPLKPIEREKTFRDSFHDDDFLRERVGELIEQLDPWALEYAVLSMTGMSVDELSEIEDLSGYASRLADVVMKGVITEGSSLFDSPSTIAFTRNIMTFQQGESAETVFDSSTRRIYAVFPTDGYDGNSVLMKWYRMDMPSEVRIKTQPILQGAPDNYVWAELEEWPKALYKVEIYSSGELLEPLAVGEYEVADPVP